MAMIDGADFGVADFEPLPRRAPASPSPSVGGEDHECFTCPIAQEYIGLTNDFTQDLMVALLPAMTALFLSIVGVWVVFNGIKMVLGKMDISGFFYQLIFVFISWTLLESQGADLVNTIFRTSLDTIGGTAAAALAVGNNAGAGISGDSLSGMVALLHMAEVGIFNVLGMGQEIMALATLTNWLPLLYGLLLIAPFFLLFVVYFSQVVLAIFRIMMLASLSPFLMLAFAFGWGRSMAVSAVRTLLSAFMVLFGATAALTVILYGITALNIGDSKHASELSGMASLYNPTFFLAVALGWLGTAFMTEATGMANSIAGSSLTNTAVGVMTAGATATAAAAMMPAARQMQRGAGDMANLGASGAAQGIGYGAGAVGHGSRIMERFLTGDGTRPMK